MTISNDKERRMKFYDNAAEILVYMANTPGGVNLSTQRIKNHLVRLDKISCCFLMVGTILTLLAPFGLNTSKWAPVLLYLMLFSSAFTYIFIRQYLERMVEF